MQANSQEMSWLDRMPSSCSMSENIPRIPCRLVELGMVVVLEVMVLEVMALEVMVDLVVEEKVDLVVLGERVDLVEPHHNQRSLDNRTERAAR